MQPLVPPLSGRLVRISALAGILALFGPPASPQQTTIPLPAAAQDTSSSDKSTTEEELRRQFIDKPLYLRGGYLDNNLSFDEYGRLVSQSPQGSYTLSAIEIEKVRLTKHKIELEGIRYGLHFLGEMPYEDSTSAFDRVRITPRKKVVRITIGRELVVVPKKHKKKDKELPSPLPPEQRELDSPAGSGNAASGPTTTSPAHAAALLQQALDNVFAQGLDERMMASMPDFWKLYYQAAAAKTDYRPRDPAVLRQSTVDTRARLLTNFEPPSNEYAQANAIAGMALYHAVIGVDGVPGEIAVARPIGFGLDENAVEAIRKARFQPAGKDGKPVPVLLDLVVQFRIYSNRTAATSAPEAAGKSFTPTLPGPYTVNQR